MHRTTRRDDDRASLRPIAGPALAAFAIVALVIAVAIAAAPRPVQAGTGEPPRPPVTIADEFLPESANLSDCVGLVERPGCGSEARGGWRQTAVFAALAIGLGLIFWRVSLGVRRNRAAADASAGTDSGAARP